MTTRRPLCLCILCTLFFSANAYARTLYVNTGAAQPGDGSSWAAPLPGLDQALSVATDGDSIWVAEGVYTPAPEAGRAATFKLVPGVAVYGGFSGNETELKKRDFKKHQTTLSGDIGQPGVPDDNVFHVVTGADRALLDGFTVTGGYSLNARWRGDDTLTPASIASGPGDGQGAGMLNYQTAPEVRNCTFQDNQALEGGAVYNMTSPSDDPSGAAARFPRFFDCIFWQNSAMGYGGGVANALHTSPLFVSCEFDSNLSDYKGGGMYNGFGASPALLNAIFRNNEAPLGGGMANEGAATPVLFYCTLTGNRATKDGPAIHQEGGANASVLLKTVVWDNECAGRDNRFLNAPGSEVRVQDSVIQGGYKGKSVFQANPGLDRKSETMLNVGYKTNGYRFVGDKLAARIKDMDRYEAVKGLPAFDPRFTAAVPDSLLATRTAPQTPPLAATAPESTPTAAPAPAPEPRPAAIPVPAPAPVEPPTIPAPEPAPVKAAAAPASAPVVHETASLKADRAPAAVPTPESEPEALAMVEPQPSVLRKEAAPSTAGRPNAEVLMLEMDHDGNGCITINEAEGPLQQQFWRVDRNGDGCLSRAELDRLDAKPKPQAQPVPERTAVQTARPAAQPAPAAPKTMASAAPAKALAPAAATAKPASSAGYTLFAPIGGKETYLVDMQGKVAKKWTSKDPSTGAVYLLGNGNLLRTVTPPKGEVRTPFEGKDVNGGIIQEVSPRGQIVWEYSYISDKVRQHHDIAPLPNGNVLLLAWEIKYASDLENVGGSIRSHPDGKIWAEHIVEVRKSGPRSGYIVWEWHAWDHLVQNNKESAPNYASPVRLPQRMDINYNPLRQADWLHANSIDFNQQLNQIVLSLRNTNEIWIIDHSTTTAQAATNAGGLMHRGGDILFRWGNPAAYGASGRQTLTGQHDARWIMNGKPGEETILVFNNGDQRNKRSDILEIKPEYYFKSTRLGAQVVWSYADSGGPAFFADTISGAQRLANGNTLVCDGATAHVFEVTAAGKPVWEYRKADDGSVSSGPLFRATRIPEDFPGLRRLSLQ